MHADLIIYNIKTLYTPHGPYQRGRNMNNIVTVDNAFIAVKDKLILHIGNGDYSMFQSNETLLYDARGLIATPGFVDSHTHLVFGGSREAEFSKKINGVPYLDILASGGGILSTVAMTRAISFESLLRKSMGSLYELGSYGVTTLEVKSGYGLNLETEIKQLEIVKALNEQTPFLLIPTYMGAHAVPTEYKGNKDKYLQSITKDLSEIKKRDLASFVDIFCEDSVFNYEDSKQFLTKAKELGFGIKIHADEIVSLGGAGLAVDLEASSADHLMAINDEDIIRISQSNTVANLLPSTSFYLNKDYAPARKLIDGNAIVSLSSDLNPGSAPSENFQLMCQIACNKLRMTPQEVLTATTINAAFNLGVSDIVGSLEVGKKADIVLMDSLNLEYIFYHFGVNHTKDIFKEGTLIYQNRRFI